TIVKRKETINQVYGQKNNDDGRKYDPSKCNRGIQFNQPRGTSALPAIQFQKETTNRNINSSKRSRPCAFCNRDHWDDECRKYTTLEERLARLNALKACRNCLKVEHNTRNCKVNQKSCFHCKQSHNSALCYIFQRRDQSQQNKSTAVTNMDQRKEVKAINAVADRNIQTKYNVLLLCREVIVINPRKPGIKAETLAFFNIYYRNLLLPFISL
ncbi:unnamed protein product, partial [Wuchereria bancrofti]